MMQLLIIYLAELFASFVILDYFLNKKEEGRLSKHIERFAWLVIFLITVHYLWFLQSVFNAMSNR